MKISSKVLPTLILTFLCAFGMANVKPMISVDLVKTNVIILQTKSNSQADIEIDIKNQEGITVFSETIEEGGLANRKYDLSLLENGNYTIIVLEGLSISVQHLTKTVSEIQIGTIESHNLVIPTFVQNDNYLDLRMLSETSERLWVSIIDENGNPIYGEYVDQKGAVKKRFILSELEGGRYTFSVEIEGSVFSKTFSHTINWESSTDAFAAL